MVTENSDVDKQNFVVDRRFHTPETLEPGLAVAYSVRYSV